ncbi:MAG: flagellar basal body L-ring protein FlgH [Candidatus Sericytochromatia bacterium]
MIKKNIFCSLLGAVLLISTPVYADSLWSDTSVGSWFTDRRPAFVIGGLVTINVNETTRASQRSTLQGNKILQNTHKWEIPAMKQAEGLFNRQLKTDNQLIFNGLGSTTRDGILIFNVTTSIEDILPNGNLVIRGRKQIRVNDEVSEITFSGVVRRDDVRADNSIESAKVANLQIDVKGTGPVSAKTTGGLLSRLFNFLL